MNRECQAELFCEKSELNASNRRITVKESLGIVFASIKSAGRSEFYEAARSGYKAQKMLRLRSVDYNEKATIVKVNDAEYKIVRDFDKGEYTELTLSKANI